MSTLTAPRHVLSTLDLEGDELDALLALAGRIKSGAAKPRLDDRTLVLLFFDPSLRTRVSFEVAMAEMGGRAIALSVGRDSWKLEHRDGVVMDGDNAEHVIEAARVLSRYGDALGVRAFPGSGSWDEERTDPVLSAFARHATVPVVNLESSLWHPCQALADLFTIRERLGAAARPRVSLVWAYHPRMLPTAVPNSFLTVCAQAGYDVTLAHPPGFELDDDMMSRASRRAREAGGAVRVVHDQAAAYDGAQVVYAKAWGAPRYWGRPDEERPLRLAHRDWMVTEEKMRATAGAFFMHCLPVRRNVVVADEVLDGPRSAVYDEAENRLHVQKALLARLLGEAV